MPKTTHRVSRTTGVVLGLALAACSSGVSSSPTGPGPAPAAPAGAASVSAPRTSSIKGTVSLVRHSSATSLTTSGLRVTLVGTALSARPDANGHFALANAPAGSATLHFEGEGANANVRLPELRAGKELRVRVAVGGQQATLECTQEVDEPDGNNNDGQHEEDVQCGDQNNDHNDGDDGNHEGDDGNHEGEGT